MNRLNLHLDNCSLNSLLEYIMNKNILIGLFKNVYMRPHYDGNKSVFAWITEVDMHVCGT